MKPELKKFTAIVGGHSITFETGQLAQQAGGAVTVRLDDSLIFASATMSDEPRQCHCYGQYGRYRGHGCGCRTKVG